MPLVITEFSTVTGLYICFDSPWRHIVSHTCLNTVVLSGPYCQINECLPLHPCYFVYWLARSICGVVGLCWKGSGRSGHGQILR